MKENVKINRKNISTFRIFQFDTSYQCVLCKTKVYTDESYSNQGDRLICFNCYNSKFKSSKQARQWINREIEL